MGKSQQVRLESAIGRLFFVLVLAAGGTGIAIAASPGPSGGGQPLADGRSDIQPQARMGDPLPGLTDDELDRFMKGKDAFSTPFTAADGLGPGFNQDSCSSCHTMPLGGSGSVSVTRFGVENPDGTFDPLVEYGGSLLQSETIHPDCQETIPDVPNLVTAQRITNSTLGMGLVEAIDDADLLALAARGSGRAHMVPVLEDPDSPLRVGRFGWKAQLATIMSFSADALLMEQGVTSEVLDEPVAPNNNWDLMDFCDSFGPDHPQEPIDDEGVRFTERLNDFQRFLAPPPQTPRSAMTGEALFNQVGCNQCHVSEFTTPGHDGIPEALRNQTVKPYSDFLLHDMGLQADFIAQGDAGQREMRTPPLWGLRVRDPIWHNGEIGGGTFEDRVMQAIERHGAFGSAAQPSYQAFAALDDSEQSKVIDFLDSLGRAEFDATGNNVVELEDFVDFAQCFSGPGNHYTADDHCAIHDINQDGAVDLIDFEYFLMAYDEDLTDCNQSGNPDIVDIIHGDSSDNNASGIPDECDSNRYDLSGDGQVNGGDLGILLSNWGPCDSPPHLCVGDFNNDGKVDGADLGMLLANWGP